jgi:hypothetical protein
LNIEQLGITQEFTVIQRGKDKKIVRDDLLMDNTTIQNHITKIHRELSLSQEEFNNLYPWG